MGKEFAKRLARWLVVVLAIAIIMVIGIVFVVPTEMVHSRDTEFIERRISSDMSIPRNRLEFVAGKFRREAVVIFRLPNDAVSVDKFSRLSSLRQRMEAAKRISDVAHACGVRIIPSEDDDLLEFRGVDYSAVCLNTTNESYLIFFGAQ